MSTLLEIAMYWRKAGVATIPIRFREKTPEFKWEKYQKELPSTDELKKWFPGQLHNIGLVTGWMNIVVLDFDDLGTFLKWSTWIARQGGFSRRAAELTHVVRTARGVHVYFRTQQPEQNRKLPGIDIKSRGGYVLIPPSIHPSLVPYTVYQNGSPMMIEALSEVLPSSYLVQQTSVSTPVKVSSAILSNQDPWNVIMHTPDPKQDLIDQIRATYRIESFFPNASDTGGNRWFMDVCPFHDDSKPSFWIDTQRQICACYAGCTPKPLDVINLYARLHGLTNRDAIFYMAHQL